MLIDITQNIKDRLAVEDSINEQEDLLTSEDNVETLSGADAAERLLEILAANKRNPIFFDGRFHN